MKFIAALHKALLTKSLPEKENSSENNSASIIQDVKLVEGILQSMSSVWVSLSGALKTKENEPLRTFLENTYGKGERRKGRKEEKRRGRGKRRDLLWFSQNGFLRTFLLLSFLQFQRRGDGTPQYADEDFRIHR